jgi:hypothetical protein
MAAAIKQLGSNVSSVQIVMTLVIRDQGSSYEFVLKV